MPKFSTKSLTKLSSCDTVIQQIFFEVIKTWDCTIITGHRGPREQAEAYKSGKSKVQYPDSKHNSYPSQAIDVAPYPINWKDLGSFYMFAGYVKRVAEELGYELRYGGDWDGDTKTLDQNFNDLVHFELKRRL